MPPCISIRRCISLLVGQSSTFFTLPRISMKISGFLTRRIWGRIVGLMGLVVLPTRSDLCRIYGLVFLNSCDESNVAEWRSCHEQWRWAEDIYKLIDELFSRPVNLRTQPLFRDGPKWGRHIDAFVVQRLKNSQNIYLTIRIRKKIDQIPLPSSPEGRS